MTEYPGQEDKPLDDAEIERLFTEQSQSEQAELEARIAVEESQRQIVSELDEVEALHLWHPSAEQKQRNISDAMAGLLDATLEGMPEGLPSAVRVQLRMHSELTAIALLSMHLAVDSSEVKPIDKSAMDEQAKRTIIEIWKLGLGDSWAEAASRILIVSVDLTDEADLQLYLDESLSERDSEISTKMRIARDVLVGGATAHEHTVDEMLRINGLAAQVGYLIIKANRAPRERADSEGQIYELASQGTLSALQRDELLKLLPRPE